MGAAIHCSTTAATPIFGAPTAAPAESYTPLLRQGWRLSSDGSKVWTQVAGPEEADDLYLVATFQGCKLACDQDPDNVIQTRELGSCSDDASIVESSATANAEVTAYRRGKTPRLGTHDY